MKKYLLVLLLCAITIQWTMAEAVIPPQTPVKKEATKSSKPKTQSKTTAPLKKDGTPDKRYKENKHLKKDGTPDKRYGKRTKKH